jgi:hypothetical protein
VSDAGHKFTWPITAPQTCSVKWTNTRLGPLELLSKPQQTDLSLLLGSLI